MVLNAPLPDYIQSWKAFRLASNENHVLGRYVASKLNEIDGSDLSVMDIGTGDGKLLQSALMRCKTKPKRVTVVEPDKEFSLECRRNLSISSLANEFQFLDARLSDLDTRCISEHSVFIASHVLYLIDWSEFELLLKTVPPDAAIFIIVDSNDSVFAEIWRETAPRHRARVDETLAKLQEGYSAQIRSQTIVQSKLSDPRQFRCDIKDMILSLLSYADVRDLDADTYSWVESTVAKRVMDGHIPCDSLCMEIRGPSL